MTVSPSKGEEFPWEGRGKDRGLWIQILNQGHQWNAYAGKIMGKALTRVRGTEREGTRQDERSEKLLTPAQSVGGSTGLKVGPGSGQRKWAFVPCQQVVVGLGYR